MILVDFRERQSKIPQMLQEFHLAFQTDDLPIDYIIDGECFVERKTINDFVISVERTPGIHPAVFSKTENLISSLVRLAVFKT